jgi:hypothetical protein
MTTHDGDIERAAICWSAITSTGTRINTSSTHATIRWLALVRSSAEANSIHAPSTVVRSRPRRAWSRGIRGGCQTWADASS